MRALEDIDYNGLNIHYNARLYGVASYKGGRFFIDINRVKTSEGEFSVNMKVYDNDGIEGLFYKSGIEKNLEDDKDNLVSDIARKSRRYEGEIIGDVVEELNEGVVNEKLKPLKKENYSIYVASN
jgi:predicted DNA-binding helix-hairpin-helix protein